MLEWKGNVVHFVLFFHCVCASGAIVGNYGFCLTANRELGRCVNLTDCGYLWNRLSDADLTGDEINYWRYSRCGLQDDLILICCPSYFMSENMPQILPEPPECGMMTTKPSDSDHETAGGEFPWMALVEHTDPDDIKIYHCGGTLINSRYVITAAHCVVGLKIPWYWRLTGVRLGESSTDTSAECELQENRILDCAPTHLDVVVVEKLPHPFYALSSNNYENDIALLRLAHNVPFSDYVRPICLSGAMLRRHEHFQGRRMEVTGWSGGATSVANTRKLKAAINVWNWERCRAKYQRVNVTLKPTHLCASGSEHAEPCCGNPGGPLMITLNDGLHEAYYLAGVVSFDARSSGLHDGKPDVYVRMSAYMHWVEGNIRP